MSNCSCNLLVQSPNGDNNYAIWCGVHGKLGVSGKLCPIWSRTLLDFGEFDGYYIKLHVGRDKTVTGKPIKWFIVRDGRPQACKDNELPRDLMRIRPSDVYQAMQSLHLEGRPATPNELNMSPTYSPHSPSQHGDGAMSPIYAPHSPSHHGDGSIYGLDSNPSNAVSRDSLPNAIDLENGATDASSDGDGNNEIRDCIPGCRDITLILNEQISSQQTQTGFRHTRGTSNPGCSPIEKKKTAIGVSIETQTEEEERPTLLQKAPQVDLNPRLNVDQVTNIDKAQNMLNDIVVDSVVANRKRQIATYVKKCSSRMTNADMDLYVMEISTEVVFEDISMSSLRQIRELIRRRAKRDDYTIDVCDLLYMVDGVIGQQKHALQQALCWAQTSNFAHINQVRDLSTGVLQPARLGLLSRVMAPVISFINNISSFFYKTSSIVLGGDNKALK
jgi:hypothetical protein